MNTEQPTSNIQHSIKVEKTYDLEERLLEYSTRILELVAKLPKTMEYLRSETSVYPNHAEAQSAESIADFIHKIRTSLKELRETKCWLRLIKNLKSANREKEVNSLLQETEGLIKIFVSSIKTAEKNKLNNRGNCKIDW